MNCKPGDMAVVIKANLPENVGLIVEVVRYVGGDRALWATKSVWPARSVRFDGTLPPGNSGLAPDAWLRPIRPGDLSDDTVTDKTLEIA